MKASSSFGTCELCESTFSKAAMARHLVGCKQAGPAAIRPGIGQAGDSFHLLIEGRCQKDYWLHLALPMRSPLKKLDGFLRDIWLECCGHLSAFEIAGERYDINPDDEDSIGPKPHSMNVPAGQVLRVGATFSHEYDFGSTTELILKVVGLRGTDGQRRGITLLARNNAPKIPCDGCKTGEPASQVCSDCQWHGQGWLCKECAKTHKCGLDMLLPLVNSPRVGVCGYTG